MWWVLAALADEPAVRSVDFLRVDQPLTVRRYATIRGRPAFARNRNTKGRYEAWVFADARVERAREWDGRRLIADARYDAVGDPWATVRHDDNGPFEVIVHGRTDVTVAVGPWNDAPFGDVVLRLPPVASHADGTLTALVAGGGAWRAVWAPADDVYADAFRDSLAMSCACEVVDRYTVFADDRAGAGYLVWIPGLHAPRLGEVWALPAGEQTLILTYSAPTGFEAAGIDDPAVRLATGRAIVALLRWKVGE